MASGKFEQKKISEKNSTYVILTQKIKELEHDILILTQNNREILIKLSIIGKLIDKKFKEATDQQSLNQFEQLITLLQGDFSVIYAEIFRSMTDTDYIKQIKEIGTLITQTIIGCGTNILRLTPKASCTSKTNSFTTTGFSAISIYSPNSNFSDFIFETTAKNFSNTVINKLDQEINDFSKYIQDTNAKDSRISSHIKSLEGQIKAHYQKAQELQDINYLKKLQYLMRKLAIICKAALGSPLTKIKNKRGKLLEKLYQLSTNTIKLIKESIGSTIMPIPASTTNNSSDIGERLEKIKTIKLLLENKNNSQIKSTSISTSSSSANTTIINSKKNVETEALDIINELEQLELTKLQRYETENSLSENYNTEMLSMLKQLENLQKSISQSDSTLNITAPPIIASATTSGTLSSPSLNHDLSTPKSSAINTLSNTKKEVKKDSAMILRKSKKINKKSKYINKKTKPKWVSSSNNMMETLMKEKLQKEKEQSASTSTIAKTEDKMLEPATAVIPLLIKPPKIATQTKSSTTIYSNINKSIQKNNPTTSTLKSHTSTFNNINNSSSQVSPQTKKPKPAPILLNTLKPIIVTPKPIQNNRQPIAATNTSSSFFTPAYSIIKSTHATKKPASTNMQVISTALDNKKNDQQATKLKPMSKTFEASTNSSTLASSIHQPTTSNKLISKSPIAILKRPTSLISITTSTPEPQPLSAITSEATSKKSAASKIDDTKSKTQDEIAKRPPSLQPSITSLPSSSLSYMPQLVYSHQYTQPSFLTYPQNFILSPLVSDLLLTNPLFKNTLPSIRRYNPDSFLQSAQVFGSDNHCLSHLQPLQTLPNVTPMLSTTTKDQKQYLKDFEYYGEENFHQLLEKIKNNQNILQIDLLYVTDKQMKNLFNILFQSISKNQLKKIMVTEKIKINFKRLGESGIKEYISASHYLQTPKVEFSSVTEQQLIFLASQDKSIHINSLHELDFTNRIFPINQATANAILMLYNQHPYLVNIGLDSGFRQNLAEKYPLLNKQIMQKRLSNKKSFTIMVKKHIDNNNLGTLNQIFQNSSLCNLFNLLDKDFLQYAIEKNRFDFVKYFLGIFNDDQNFLEYLTAAQQLANKNGYQKISNLIDLHLQKYIEPLPEEKASQTHQTKELSIASIKSSLWSSPQLQLHPISPDSFLCEYKR